MKKKRTLWQNPQEAVSKAQQKRSQGMNTDEGKKMTNEEKEMGALEKELLELQNQVQTYYLEHPEKRSEYPDKIFVKSVEELEEKITEHIPKRVVEDEIVEKRIVDKTITVGESPLDFSLMNEIGMPKQYVNSVFQAEEEDADEDVDDKRQRKSEHTGDQGGEHGTGLSDSLKDYFEQFTMGGTDGQSGEMGLQGNQNGAMPESGEGFERTTQGTSEGSGTGMGAKGSPAKMEQAADPVAKTMWKNRVFTGGGIDSGGFGQSEMFGGGNTGGDPHSDSSEDAEDLFQRLLQENSVDWSIIGDNETSLPHQSMPQPEMPAADESAPSKTGESGSMGAGSRQIKTSDSAESFNIDYESFDREGTDDQKPAQQGEYYNNRVFSIKWEETDDETLDQGEFAPTVEYYSQNDSDSGDKQSAISRSDGEDQDQKKSHSGTKEDGEDESGQSNGGGQSPDIETKIVKARRSDKAKTTIREQSKDGRESQGQIKETGAADSGPTSSAGGGTNQISGEIIEELHSDESGQAEGGGVSLESTEESGGSGETGTRGSVQTEETDHAEAQTGQAEEEDISLESILGALGDSMAGADPGYSGNVPLSQNTGSESLESLLGTDIPDNKKGDISLGSADGDAQSNQGDASLESALESLGGSMTEAVAGTNRFGNVPASQTQNEVSLESERDGGIGGSESAQEQKGILPGTAADGEDHSNPADEEEVPLESTMESLGDSMAGLNGSDVTEVIGGEDHSNPAKGEGVSSDLTPGGSGDNMTGPGTNLKNAGKAPSSTTQKAKSNVPQPEGTGSNSLESLLSSGSSIQVEEEEQFDQRQREEEKTETAALADGVKLTKREKREQRRQRMVERMIQKEGSLYHSALTEGDQSTSREEAGDGEIKEAKSSIEPDQSSEPSGTGGRLPLPLGSQDTISGSAKRDIKPDAMHDIGSPADRDQILSAPGDVKHGENHDSQSRTIRQSSGLGQSTGESDSSVAERLKSKEMLRDENTSGANVQMAPDGSDPAKGMEGTATHHNKLNHKNPVQSGTMSQSLSNMENAPDKTKRKHSDETLRKEPSVRKAIRTSGNESILGKGAEKSVQSNIRQDKDAGSSDKKGASAEKRAERVRKILHKDKKDDTVQSWSRAGTGVKGEEKVKTENQVPVDPEKARRQEMERAIQEKLNAKKTQKELQAEQARNQEAEMFAEQLRMLLQPQNKSDQPARAKEVSKPVKEVNAEHSPNIKKVTELKSTSSRDIRAKEDNVAEEPKKPLPKDEPTEAEKSEKDPVEKEIPVPVSAVTGVKEETASDAAFSGTGNTMSGPIISTGAASDTGTPSNSPSMAAVLSGTPSEADEPAKTAPMAGISPESPVEVATAKAEAKAEGSESSSKKLSKREKQRLREQERKKMQKEQAEKKSMPVAGEQIPQIDIEKLEKGINLDSGETAKTAVAQATEETVANVDKASGALAESAGSGSSDGNGGSTKQLSKREKQRLRKLEKQKIKQERAGKEKVTVAGKVVPVAGEQISTEDKKAPEQEKTALENPPVALKESPKKEKKPPFWKSLLEKISNLFRPAKKKIQPEKVPGIESFETHGDISVEDGIVNSLEGVVEGAVRGESIILELHSVIKSDVVVTDCFYCKQKSNVFGNVFTKRAIIEGTVTGDVKATQSIEIKAGGCVLGNVYAPSISIDVKGYVAGDLTYEKGDVK